MPTTRRRALTTTVTAALTTALAVPAARAAGGGPARHRPGPGVRPLRRAHAHNDYLHPRPLHDALAHGFTSAEADVFLVDGELLVAHTPAELDPARTLRSLYLDPLAERIRAHHGTVFPGHRRPFQLLIDIKHDGAACYRALDRLLRTYHPMFSRWSHGRVRPGPVTAVISGDRAARGPMAAQRRRHAFYDGRLDDLGTTAPASFAPLISANWTLAFDWRGTGPFPAAERARLRALVDTAHREGRRIRFWATPDEPGPARDALWTALADLGVDHINTDDLPGLERFLRTREAGRDTGPGGVPDGG
ncbi:phosphatidylinositol-specific phospholipase C/glycerophosphodiester phosphodiesterase family protein [Streptomyces sp. NPDC006798]|uniref:phosphatidylinositol-specific phospholipase C/glycerophosphodiester phosphodiesterase family protein n=1 Tax=Streptomyces sp. NPDC006798 TaxID=3155462 RepID=UPI0033D8823E